jgi:3-oxoadipate enol-lactonase
LDTIKGYAQLTDVEMYYEIAGKGEHLLLIHGLDSDSRMWEEQFHTFSQFFRTIRFDCRGFGKTPMPAGEFQILDDIHNLMNEIGIESAHILGYSYGGTLAPTFALKYPGKVKSLILASPGMVGHQWSPVLQDYF